VKIFKRREIGYYEAREAIHLHQMRQRLYEILWEARDDAKRGRPYPALKDEDIMEELRRILP
jgi:hypothetical protein